MLVGHWPLIGNTNDYSGYNNNATNFGATVSTAIGKIGSSYQFNGTSHYMTVNNPVKAATNWTISFWFRRNGSFSWSDILTFDTGVDSTAARIEQSGSVTNQYFWFVETGFPSGSILWVTAGDNIWEHITLVVNDTTARSFKNGVLQYSYTKNTNPLPSSNLINIGRRLTSQYLGMYLNDLRIYDHALSDYEVKELAKAKIIHYTFDDPNEEPTVNILSGKLTATTHTRNFEGKTISGWQLTGVADDNPRLFIQSSSIEVSASTYYAFSALYYSSTGVIDDVYFRFNDSGWPEGTIYFQPFVSGQSTTKGGTSTITNLGGGWFYCVGTFLTNAATTTILWVFLDSDVAGTTVFIGELQLEQKNYATPFTNGTRNIGVADSSGLKTNGNVSEISTSPRWVSDSKIGSGSIYFNGTNPNIQIPITSFVGLTTVTISFWRKNDTIITNWLPFSGQTNSFYIMATSSGTGGFYHNGIGSSWEIFKDGVGQGIGVAATPFTDQNWHHYAIRNVTLETWTILKLNGYTGVWNNEGYFDDVRIYNTNLSNADILALYNKRANFDNLGNVSSSEFVEKINYLDPAIFTQYSNNSKDPGYQVVDGRDTWRVFPAWYHPNGSQDGRFKANTQYEYNIWIKHSSYWTGGPYYVPGGFRVRYTDGSFTDIISSGAIQDWVNLIGITVANKTIDDLYVYYFVSYEVKVDINSYFVEAGTISINNQGIADYVSFNEVDGTENINAQQEIKQYNKNLLINGEFSEVD
jgi:hypothetical protein